MTLRVIGLPLATRSNLFACQSKKGTQELINSVDSDQYSDSSLYQELRETKPEYGANRRIQVKLVNGEVTITNVHIRILSLNA